MGQNVMAVVYGVKALNKRDSKRLFDESGDFKEGFPKDKVPRLEQGTEAEVLGIAVAVSGAYDEEHGEVDMPSGVRAAYLEEALKKPLKGATKKWDAFEKWAESKGITFDEPQLFLVTVERA